MINRDDIAKQIQPALGQLGERPAGYARLGRGDRSGVIVKDFAYRTVYYYNEGQPTAFAPLSTNVNITAINNVGFEGVRVRLGYPNYNPSVLHVLGLDSGEGLDAVGGLTPAEQLVTKAQYPDVGSLINFRLSPNNPIDTTVFVNGGFYYDDTGALQYFGGDSIDLAATIAALASGEHQMAVIALNVSTGDLGIVVNTAATGTDKELFDQVTIIDMTYDTYDLAKGAVHLYYGQTSVVEDDIYRLFDPRVLFTRPGAGGGGGGDILIPIKRSWFGI